MVNSHLTVMDPDDRQCLIARSAVQKKTKNGGTVRTLCHLHATQVLSNAALEKKKSACNTGNAAAILMVLLCVWSL